MGQGAAVVWREANMLGTLSAISEGKEPFPLWSVA